MARITKTTDLGNGLTQTVENRTSGVRIVPSLDGTMLVVFERETVTRINGQPVGGPMPCQPVALTDAQVRAIPSFAIVYNAISQAADAAEQAMVDAQAQAAQG